MNTKARFKSPWKVLALAGDGIGPEVVGAALEVLHVIAHQNGVDIELHEDLLGGVSYDAYGTFCRDRVVDQARVSDAVLVGAVGGPRWDGLDIDGEPADKDGLTRLRQELDVFAGLRPAVSRPHLISRTPFRRDVIDGADVLVVRELCSGLYFGKPRGIEPLAGGGEAGYDANYYTSFEIERIARVGFELARKRRANLTSIDKSNVMESGALWRRTVDAIGRTDYPDVRLRHLFADNAMYQLVMRPGQFDVILGDNLLADLISDLAGSLSGSLGMLPSASLCGLESGDHTGIFEPVHGSAPDIAGQGIANPMGTMLSVGMMLEYAFARQDLARQVDSAVDKVLARKISTPDLGGEAGTREVTRAVIRALEET